MRVTKISHESHKCDGLGVERVIISYEIGNVEKTATIFYDKFLNGGAFGTNADFKMHQESAADLMNIADSYMELVEYGWEG